MSGGNATAKTGPTPDDKGDGKDVRSLAEWVTLIASVAILAGMFAIVTYLSFAGDNDPIMIRTKAQLGQMRVSDETYYVPISVFNDGDTTAGAVQIQAELKIGEDVETSEFSIMALAGNDTESGVIAFSRDPRDGELTVRVASYTE